MGIYYDKRRDHYIVRVSSNGQRKYVGSFKTMDEAKEKDIESKVSELSKFKLEYEPEDISIDWLQPYRAWKTRLANKRAKKLLARHVDQMVDEKLERL